jgi:L-arabinose isomerase
MQPLNIGLFGIGLEAYWAQFDGLQQRLQGYLQTVEQLLQRPGCKVVNAGLVDSYDAAIAAGRYLKQHDVGILFLYATTYALSSTVLPIVQMCKVPVILLNLSPTAAIDYTRFNQLGNRTEMTGEWLAHCGACPIPEIANVLRRCQYPFYQVTGVLQGDDDCEKQIHGWVAAATVAHTLFYNRMGAMGHYYSGMLDIYTDVTKLLATFGGHFEIIEVDELTALRSPISPIAAAERVALFHQVFDVQPDCSREALLKAAVTSLALDELVAKYKLGSLAYYYKGTGVPANEETMSTIILGTSWLTANHIPVAGEYEIKNAMAMKIMDVLGAGGSFTEYYAMDYTDNVVLMGHDGPGHLAIAEGKIKVRPLEVYHGKVGKGLSVEMAVKHGPVTLLSVVENRYGAIEFLVAEGESVPGPILAIGNTNSRYRFPLGAKGFADAWNSHGPAHHCAVGIGHVGDTIDKLGKLLGIEVRRVC